MLRAQSSRRSPIILAQSGVAASVTGTLTETTLASVTIPGGMMGTNGSLRIKAKWTYTNSVNNKTIKSVFGGQAVTTGVRTTSTTEFLFYTIDNRGSLSSQMGPNTAIPSSSSLGTYFPLTVDTSVDQTLTFTGTLANTGETITLEGYTVEVLPA